MVFCNHITGNICDTSVYQILWVIYHQFILSRIKNFNVKITHGEKLPSSCLILLKINRCKEKTLTQICANWLYLKLAKLALPIKKQSELNKSYLSCIVQLTLHLSFHFLMLLEYTSLKFSRGFISFVYLQIRHYIQEVRNIIMANSIDWPRSYKQLTCQHKVLGLAQFSSITWKWSQKLIIYSHIFRWNILSTLKWITFL